MNVYFFAVVASVVSYEMVTQPCVRELRCDSQMERVGNYGAGLFDDLLNPTIFRNLCLEKDECQGLDLRTINVCIRNGLHYLPISLSYRRNIHRFLCSNQGKNLVRQLPNSQCAKDKAKQQELDNARGQCVFENQDKTGILSQEPLDCRILIAYKCNIREFGRYCGSVWSNLQRDIVDAMVKYLPHCTGYLAKPLI